MNKIIENALRNERKRQEENIELIASENYVSNDILKLQGSMPKDILGKDIMADAKMLMLLKN